MDNANKGNANSPQLRKVFIQRDYTEGTAVKFQLKFPTELEGRVSDFVDNICITDWISFDDNVNRIIWLTDRPAVIRALNHNYEWNI